MPELTGRQFGFIIAYLLPGFIGLAGVAAIVPAVARWLRPMSGGDFGVGAPLYVLLAAIAMGSTVSCFRWLTLDQLHAATGIHRPALDDRRLMEVLSAFDYLVQNHFRYYEFCGNSLISLLWAYGVNRYLGTVPFFGLGTDGVILIVCLTLFAASRDALTKYYSRTGRLVGDLSTKD